MAREFKAIRSSAWWRCYAISLWWNQLISCDTCGISQSGFAVRLVRIVVNCDYYWIMADLEFAADAVNRIKPASQSPRDCLRSHAILVCVPRSPQIARALHLPRRSPWRKPGCQVVDARTHPAHRHQHHQIRVRPATEALLP